MVIKRRRRLFWDRRRFPLMVPFLVNITNAANNMLYSGTVTRTQMEEDYL